jgi:hypothetical protein
MTTTESAIAYFISPHGFGHAARSSAVMAAIHQRQPTRRFEIFTLVPEWFFAESLAGPFGYHPLLTDIGLVQKTSLAEDLPETGRRLADFLPFDPAKVNPLAELVKNLGCRLVMCDIAPLGIAVAQAAGLPSVLVENFTWDWIYEGYLPAAPALAEHISYLQSVFASADYHIQTEPACRPDSQADLTVPPVSRSVRTPAPLIRQQLGLPNQADLTLLTMGGTPWQYTFLEQLEKQNGTYFIFPGVGEHKVVRHNLVFLPNHSSFFHPDLTNAVDVVIGKVGYSTLAEVYQAGVPYGYVLRPQFRESSILEKFIETKMNSLAITETEFERGDWLAKLPNLLELPRKARQEANGADQVASFILEKVSFQ